MAGREIRLSDKINIFKKIIQARAFKKRTPLVVSWNLSNKCNLRCAYCSYWKKDSKELDTKQILRIIDEIAELGTKFITFTGGEPLLRKDLARIIARCRQKNIYVTVNTNGTLLEEFLDRAEQADELQVSLDGPPSAHDIIRGNGVHEKVIRGIELCKDKNINVNITTAISKYNTSGIDYMLDLAQKYKLYISFQAADPHLSGDSTSSNQYIADEEAYKKAIEQLIRKKSQGYEFIKNSVSGLKYLSTWPRKNKIFCFARFLYCSIEPDGSIFICDGVPEYGKFLAPIKSDFKQTFDSLSLPGICQRCWCGSIIEFNLVGEARIDSLIGLAKRCKRS